MWDLTRDYWQNATPYSRGDGCTGADAADVPIAPLLLRRSEIAAGEIRHAMRFTISNDRIRDNAYVHPATNNPPGSGGPSGGSNTMPYGARLRLRADYPIQNLSSDQARVVAQALQKYGMFMDDGGNPFISGTKDLCEPDCIVDMQSLYGIKPSDFEMIDPGTLYIYSEQNCSRTQVTN